MKKILLAMFCSAIMTAVFANAPATRQPVKKDVPFEQLDRYMQRKKINKENLAWHDPRDGKFKVEGFYWFEKEKRYHRFPAEAEKTVPPKVMKLAGCTAGGQIRFRTDSSRIVLAVRNSSGGVSATMAPTGRSGFDLYVGTPGSEVFWNSGRPASDNVEWTDEIFSSNRRQMREFRLNFPLYNGVDSLLIALDKDAQILPPTPLADSRPIVIYGTSITQGGCASRPGSAFTNRLSRMLQMEFLNYGFSGNGNNQDTVAKVIAQVKNPAMIIMDSEANSISVAKAQERVPVFLDILRAAHPQVPIVIVTKVTYGPRYGIGTPPLKKVFKDIYEKRLAAGDKNLYFIDGSEFWSEDFHENTVDGAHPTDLGFKQMADKMYPQLKKILNK